MELNRHSMKYRDAFFLLLIAGLALLSLTGIAANGYAAQALHAQSDGFEALVNRVFADDTCERRT